MSKYNLRAEAAKTIHAVLQQGHSLRECMAAAQLPLNDKDKAWLQQMVFGVLRQLPLLQYWLRQLLQKPLKNKNSIVESLLLLGFYQLAYSRVSQHAAVSETVAACQALKQTPLKGLTNGVLRNFIRQDLASHLPDDEQILSGLPRWLYQRLHQQYQANLPALLQAMHQQAPLWLRINTQRCRRDNFCHGLQQQQIEFILSPLHPQAVILPRSLDVTSLPGFDQGWFAVQDGAAQMAAQLLAPQAGDRVLDACAAPGGKTCHLLEQQPNMAELVAVESDAQRADRIDQNLQRLGHQARVCRADANDLSSWWDGKLFDCILLDAPCSATGVIRRHPDIKWLRKDGDIATLQGLQAQLLKSMWSILKPGGRLLYATCSILADENQQQITAFMQQNPDAQIVPLAPHNQPDDIGWQILPGQEQMDGFYYCLLLKSA